MTSFKQIPRDDLLSLLRAGVARTKDFMAELTEYHGGAVGTEYILTADIARECLRHHHEVKVECLNRSLVNGLTAKSSANVHKTLRAKRTDVALLYGSTIPLALIEIKIRVRTLAPLKDDLQKIIDTISLLKSAYARNVIGCIVFEVHVAGTDRNDLRHKADFKQEIVRVEQVVSDQLALHLPRFPMFDISLHPLQGDDDGITERELESDEDSGQSWGQHGHATRYHAILIQSNLPAPPPPSNFAELRARLSE